ncbi:hypothetical protein F2P56_002375 [Juglans regia]|uniref:Glutathione S-transferase T3-like n=2 Tax=Juglans regia TaxID=51240 RepID=A0A834DAZ5_JUGRE|nr:uncharacterized protein LOC109008687 isoform X2 [Juglans regia]KAF5481746.1 hypothetical protein F2P56_002375 [Juglans regia]
MALIGRGSGFRRVGGGYRRTGAYRRPPRPPRISSCTPSENDNEDSSNDSTQPPSIVAETEVGHPMLDAHTSRSEVVPEPIQPNVGPTRRGRGPAKCIEFDKLRKHGKIPLKINDGQTAPCCENANMFTTRVTWILKHHADMSHARWTDVPMVEKDELMERVRADFILDWDLANHRQTVWKQLRKRFNAFHHQLHKKYLSYGSHEEALAGGTGLVSNLVWVKLCGRWGSEAFKKMSKQKKENRNKLKTNHTAGRKSFVRVMEEKRSTTANLVEFYKEVRWSRSKDKFVTSTTEELYKQMVEKMEGMEPEQRTEEAAASVFREVLGHRPGYARGLGEMVIPTSTRQQDREREKRHAEEVERYKKDAEYYKTQFEELRGDVRVLIERQREYDKTLYNLMSGMSQGESQRETQGAA